MMLSTYAPWLGRRRHVQVGQQSDAVTPAGLSTREKPPGTKHRGRRHQRLASGTIYRLGIDWLDRASGS